jgi:branched-chain amino acid transport system permease protein
MSAIEVILGGVILGGLYALVAIGFNLQYGMARIVNLAYGEFLMGAAFAAFWMFTLFSINPILGMILTVPVTFGANWLVYRLLMTPLVRRARTRDQLEGETILATFGLLFVLRGAATLAFSANNRFYDYLGEPLHLFGFTFAANRVLAFAVACVFGGAIWLALNYTRFGTALRALAIDPTGAELVGIDVRGLSALAFAGGGALVAAGRDAGEHLSHLQSFDRHRIHDEGAGGGDHGRRRQHGRQPAGGLLARHRRSALLLLRRFRSDTGGRLRAVPGRAGDQAARPVRNALMAETAENARIRRIRAAVAIGTLAALVIVLAMLPFVLSDYGLSLLVNVMAYLVLTIAWALFSGTTRLVSLATSAFFGVGMYTVAMLINVLPLYATFAVAIAVGAVLALVVGVLTLRISGMFFVIFSFGLSEMIRELMVWWEINQTHTMGRYVYVPFDTTMIYEHLLGLAVLVFFVGWQLRRSRFGLALMVIGEDETVARQVGINVPFSKVTIFIVSAMFMTLTGALMAPRFGFINPNFAFNPLVSFQVVIMAILGGLQRLWGPVLGVIPLLVLSEELQTEFPFWYSVLLGLVFMVIVYFLPRGLTGLIEEGWAALGKPLDLPRGLTGPLLDAWGWLSRPILLPRGLAGAIEDRWVKIMPRLPEKR